MEERLQHSMGRRSIDEDINVSIALDGLLDEMMDLLFISRIGLDSNGLPAFRADLLDNVFCRCRITQVRDDHACALRSHHTSGRGANATSSANNKSNFSFECHRNLLLEFLSLFPRCAAFEAQAAVRKAGYWQSALAPGPQQTADPFC